MTTKKNKKFKFKQQVRGKRGGNKRRKKLERKRRRNRERGEILALISFFSPFFFVTSRNHTKIPRYLQEIEELGGEGGGRQGRRNEGKCEGDIGKPITITFTTI